MVIIRSVETTDKQYFAKWWRDPQLIKVTSGDFRPLSDEDISRYFNEITTSPTALHNMIEVDGQIIGHISLSKQTDEWWETQIIIGEKTMQGKGFGTEAIILLVNEALRNDIKNIYLDVRPDNFKAITAYKKAGFRQIGDETTTGNNKQPKLIRMEYLQ